MPDPADAIAVLRDLIPVQEVRKLMKEDKLHSLSLLYILARAAVLKKSSELDDRDIERLKYKIGHMALDEYVLFYELLAFTEQIDLIRFSVSWAILTHKITA